MDYLIIFMLIVFLFLTVYRRDFQNPLIYFFGIWILCLVLSQLDAYHSLIQTTNLAVCVVAVGIIGFFLGCVIPSLFVNDLRGGSRPITENRVKQPEILQYRAVPLYLALSITLVFGAFLTLNTLRLMRTGYSYSSIRDLLFSYDTSGQQYFSSTFLSTFFSWIESPLAYFLTAVAGIDVFEHRCSRDFIILAWIAIGMYTFATGGRLLILLMVAEFVFLVSYYRISVPRKYMIRAFLVVATLFVTGIVMTNFRKKNPTIFGTQSVNSIYAYFSINIPIMSHWLDGVKGSNVYGYGEAFLNGIMQPIVYVTSKMGLTLSHYTEVSAIIEQPQKYWLEVYDGHWYNAFSSLFYSFYVDFRMPGVFIGSFLFGLFAKLIQIQVSSFRHVRYLPLYIIVIQVMVSSFVRWQFGTVTFVLAAVVAVLSTKKGKTIS